jgi:hypothetical protein
MKNAVKTHYHKWDYKLIQLSLQKIIIITIIIIIVILIYSRNSLIFFMFC